LQAATRGGWDDFGGSIEGVEERESAKTIGRGQRLDDE